MGSPNTEFMQTTAAIYGEGYKEGLELIDEEGVVQVPYNSGVGVERNSDVMTSLQRPLEYDLTVTRYHQKSYYLVKINHLSDDDDVGQYTDIVVTDSGRVYTVY